MSTTPPNGNGHHSLSGNGSDMGQNMGGDMGIDIDSFPGQTVHDKDAISSTQERNSPLSRLIRDRPEDYKRLLQLIKMGSFDYVAAEACGIPAKTWRNWLRLGAGREEGIYHQLFLDVMRVKAESRMMAEITVRNEDPKFWLRNGPGKTATDRPGWTDSISVVGDAEADPIQAEQQIMAADGRDAAPVEDLAVALQMMADTGLIEFTPSGSKIVEGLPGSPTDNEYEDDAEDQQGYNPDGGTPYDQVERDPREDY